MERDADTYDYKTADDVATAQPLEQPLAQTLSVPAQPTVAVPSKTVPALGDGGAAWSANNQAMNKKGLFTGGSIPTGFDSGTGEYSYGTTFGEGGKVAGVPTNTLDGSSAPSLSAVQAQSDAQREAYNTQQAKDLAGQLKSIELAQARLDGGASNPAKTIPATTSSGSSSAGGGSGSAGGAGTPQRPVAPAPPSSVYYNRPVNGEGGGGNMVVGIVIALGVGILGIWLWDKYGKKHGKKHEESHEGK